MSGKVIIIGANQSGAFLAELLGKGGMDVTVFEKSKRGEVSFDWHDDMNPSIYQKVGIPPLEQKYRFPKANWSFVSPDGQSITKINQDAEWIDDSTERRALADYLYCRAKDVADFRFETKVASLLLQDNAVKGVVLQDGNSVTADLVVDCSGMDSVFRASLPADCGIQKAATQDEVFVAFRGFYNRAEGVAPPEVHTNKVYLKHLGQRGISWCIYDAPSDTVNVLIGRVGAITQEEYNYTLEKLKEDNPIIGDVIVRGGSFCRIPIRRPVSRFAIDGYAVLGDSAFMTIPMLGSGMANSLMAAKLLSEVVLSGGDSYFSAQNLYRYQVNYMKERGAKYTGIELLKNYLIDAPLKDVAFLFNKNILSENDLKVSCVGELIKLTPASLLSKAAKGFTRLPLLLSLSGLLGRVNKAIKLAASIPTVYNEAEFAKWRARYDGLFYQSK